MKNVKKFQGIFLIILTLSVFSVAPVSASRRKRDPVEGLKVSITDVEVLDLDGDGVKNDVKIYGKVRLKVSEEGRYRVSLRLYLKYIGNDPDNPLRGGSYDQIARKRITVYCEEGSWTEEEFVFKSRNKSGWYKARVKAKCGHEAAKSRVVVFDPPGGSVGPVSQ